MINLSDLTITYIDNTFIHEKQKVIYQSFSMLENFGKMFYENKLIDLLNKNEMSSEDKQDKFISILTDDLTSIIEEHHIFLNKDYNVDLNELNEIVSFIYIVQNLEDYDLVTYRLYAEDTSKNIILDLMEYLTLLSKPRLMEIIGMVTDQFIDSLKSFISDKQDKQDKVDNIHLIHIRNFFKFIDNTKCVGLIYFQHSFINITLEEFLDLSDIDIPLYIDKIAVTNAPQAALDCLSILLLCKDSYELPILKFKQNTSMFTSKLENVTKLESLMLHMLTDFNMFLDAKKQEEQYFR